MEVHARLHSSIFCRNHTGRVAVREENTALCCAAAFPLIAITHNVTFLPHLITLHPPYISEEFTRCGYRLVVRMSEHNITNVHASPI